MGTALFILVLPLKGSSKESQWGPNTDGVAEARALGADSTLTAMNMCKWGCVDRGVTVGHTLTHDSFHNDMFPVLHFFVACLFIWGMEGSRAKGRIWREREMSGIRVQNWNSYTKKSIKSVKTKNQKIFPTAYRRSGSWGSRHWK